MFKTSGLTKDAKDSSGECASSGADVEEDPADHQDHATDGANPDLMSYEIEDEE